MQHALPSSTVSIVLKFKLPYVEPQTPKPECHTETRVPAQGTINIPIHLRLFPRTHRYIQLRPLCIPNKGQMKLTADFPEGSAFPRSRAVAPHRYLHRLSPPTFNAEMDAPSDVGTKGVRSFPTTDPFAFNILRLHSRNRRPRDPHAFHHNQPW